MMQFAQLQLPLRILSQKNIDCLSMKLIALMIWMMDPIMIPIVKGKSCKNIQILTLFM